MKSWVHVVLAVSAAGLACPSANAQRACRSQQLKLSQGGPDGGLGHLAYAYEVTNASGEACVLEGAPALELIDRQGKAVDAAVCAGCGDYLFRARAAERVELQPGESANFLLGAFHGDSKLEPCWRFSRVRVRLAGGGRPLEYLFAGGEGDTCGLNEGVWQAGLYDAGEDLPGRAAGVPQRGWHVSGARITE